MSIVLPLEPFRRQARRSPAPIPRVVRLRSSRQPVAAATRNFDVSEHRSIGLHGPRQLLIRAIGRLADSDWTILFTAAMVVAAMMVLAVLGIRLASLGPTGAARPAVAVPSRAPESAEPLPLVVAQPAEAPAASAPAPTAAVAQATSTIDTGTPAAGARLRAEPRLEAAIIERLLHGSQVAEIGPEAAGGGRTWRQVRAPSGNIGWVDSTLLRRTGASR